MKTIKLTRNQVALVDDEDFERLNQYKWCVQKRIGGKFYATRTENKKAIYMHHCILPMKKDFETDHIDGNSLNNQKENLRYATHHQNCMNKKKQKTPTSSKYKGVYWNKYDKKWVAQIKIKEKRYNLGYFTEEKKAAIFYDIAAKELYGEFAWLNFRETK